MSHIFTVTQPINADPATVWPWLCEPERLARWMPGLRNLHSRSGGPLDENGELVYSTRRGEHSARVVAFDPGRSITLQSHTGSFFADYRYSVSATAAGSEVTLEASGRATGLSALLAPLLKARIRQSDSGQLAALAAAVDAAG
ncbi:SRPBCC family protein [Cucumibacter marinus]|uniref:SRPBCC family protein n=1 Tax=Cucumibacter marinus TaxID=1121252 RepID=UPI0004909E29|nr:SRPBCC family protein [Cucumibacter marinus]